jgi:hypothetical protein
MLAESLQSVNIRPQSNFLNVDDASTSVTKGLNRGVEGTLDLVDDHQNVQYLAAFLDAPFLEL